MQKLCPFRQHFRAGLIYTSKWGSFNILWSSTALLADESARFVHPSCLEDIGLFRAILKHCTSSSGQWKSNLEFPLTQPSFSCTQTSASMHHLVAAQGKEAKRRKTAIRGTCGAKIFKYFNNSNCIFYFFFTHSAPVFMAKISRRGERTFACARCTGGKTSAMFFFVLVNHLPNSS